MKKILLAALLIACARLCAAQTGAVSGHSYLGGTQAVTSGLQSSNYLQGIVPSATITVYLTGTQTLATIYKDGNNTPLSNPFTSNAVNGVNPGGWLFFAATNQGYDVCMSGGISPNRYPQPVCLTDQFPSSQFVVPGVTQIVAGTNVTISPSSGLGAVTINSTAGGGCAEGTCIQNDPTGTQTLTQPAGTQFLANIENGTYYAAQFGASSGIATAIADACTGTGCEVVAGVNYANTETLPANVTGAGGYGTGNYLAMPNWPGLTRVVDERGGFHSEIFDAPTGAGSYYPSANGAKFLYGLYFNSAYDVTIPGNSVSQNTSINQSFFNGLGNQINGFGGVNLKSYDTGAVNTMVSSDQGQHLERQANQSCYGVGDCLGGALEDFIVGGGYSTYNDEGTHAGDLQISEGNNVFQGTITTITNAETLQLHPTSGTGTQGNGRYLYDLTQGTGGTWPTAYIDHTSYSTNLAPPRENFVGTSFTPSWVGLLCDPLVSACTAGVDPTGRINSVAGGYAPGPIVMTVMTSAPSMLPGYATDTTGLPTTGIACVADDQYFETTTYTVDSSSTMTINFRKPHTNGVNVAVGGACQQGLEVTGATFQFNGTGTKYRQVWPVIGSLNATTLLVFDHDPQQGWSNSVLGNNTTAYCRTDSNPTTFSASGNVVTVFETDPNRPDGHFAGQTAIVTTPNATYNGTFTITYTSAYSAGIYLPVYQYTLPSAPTGTPPTSGTIQMCNTSYNLYPMAEVLSVLDPATSTVDGYFSLAPNSIAWATSDTLEEGHYFWQMVGLSGGLWSIAQQLPRPPLNDWTTAGINYGGLMAGGYNGWTIKNSTNQNEYMYYGGNAPAPQAAYRVGGLWQSGIEFTQPPAIGGALLDMVSSCQPAPYGCGDKLNSPVAIYQGSQAGHVFYDNTANSAFTFETPAIQINGLGFPSTIFAPNFGTTAFSTDLSSFTPDGRLEAQRFQFWSTFTPPTGFQPIQFYGDSGTSVGMQFPNADGSHTTYNGGNFTVGSLQFYLPGTTAAVKNAGISTDSTPGDIFMDDATPGDAGAVVHAKSLLATGIVDGKTPITITTTASASLGTTYDSGYTFNNDGANAVTYTLPAASAGLQYCVTEDEGATGTITLQTSASGQYIDNGGSYTASGGYVISGGALADAACVVGKDSTHWKLYVQSGSWVTH